MIWKLTFNKWKKMKKNRQETHQMQWVKWGFPVCGWLLSIQVLPSDQCYGLIVPSPDEHYQPNYY